ncbi:MAG: glycosyltransferase [Gemmatimonadaceae bacterium]
MQRITRSMFVAALAAALVGCASSGSGRTTTVESRGTVALTTAQSFRESMRALWSDHVVWTREYIVAAVADQPSAKAASTRLLKNQEDIGKAIVPYYSADAGNKLTDLLKQHILIAVDLVAAAKANDAAKQADADKRWHTNADEIATFLSGANPNWPKQTLLDMLNEHLTLTTQEAVARLQGNWDEDVATFDKIYMQAMKMADALSDGIIKQHATMF